MVLASPSPDGRRWARASRFAGAKDRAAVRDATVQTALSILRRAVTNGFDSPFSLRGGAS